MFNCLSSIYVSSKYLFSNPTYSRTLLIINDIYYLVDAFDRNNIYSEWAYLCSTFCNTIEMKIHTKYLIIHIFLHRVHKWVKFQIHFSASEYHVRKLEKTLLFFRKKSNKLSEFVEKWLFSMIYKNKMLHDNNNLQNQYFIDHVT